MSIEIKATEISKYPETVRYHSRGEVFLIKRKIFSRDILIGVNLSYWIYKKKKFIFWTYYGSICQGLFRVSVNSVEQAKKFIDNEYPLMSKVEYDDYEF